MFREIRRYKIDYCFLAGITSIFIFLFIVKRTDTTYLLWLTGGYGLSYLLWGIFHHAKRGHLTLKVVLEYLLVVGFALVVVSTLLL